MINAQHLRVGNLVLYKPYGNKDGEMKTIQGMLGMKAFFDRHSNESGMFHNLQGIPLTEDWLNKCGFVEGIERMQGCLVYINNCSVKRIMDDLVYLDDLRYIRIVKYLHDLQNLYFAITGNELSIQP
jgi:hypothetical protein